MEEHSINIDVRTESNKIIHMKVRRSSTVSEVRLLLEVKHDIDTSPGCLIFRNIRLADDRKLLEYKINSGAVLYVEGSEKHEELVKFLGRGGFGEVHLIKRGDKHFVNKMVDMRKHEDKDRQMVMQEMNILENLNHPNIVTYEGGYVKNGCLHIIMEYCGGGDLRQQINQMKNTGNNFQESQILTWITNVVEALAYIHERNIIHRDIKPENIFLTSKGSIKLGDFGVSSVLSEGVSRAFTIVGTPLYIAPEAWENGFNKKTDMFAVGCCMYELAQLESSYPHIQVVLYESYSKEFKSLVTSLLDRNLCNRPDAKKVLQLPLFMTAAERKVAERHQNITEEIFQESACRYLACLMEGQSLKLEQNEKAPKYLTQISRMTFLTSVSSCLEEMDKFCEDSRAGLHGVKIIALDEILFAMQTHQQILDIQRKGCYSLGFITQGKDKSVTSYLLTSSADVEEIASVLINALEKYADDYSILIYGSLRLYEFGKLYQLQHAHNAESLIMSLWITFSNISEVKRLRKHVMSPATVKVLLDHFDPDITSNEISRKVTHILVNLLSDGENAWTISSPHRFSVIKKIVETMLKWDLDSPLLTVSRRQVLFDYRRGGRHETFTQTINFIKSDSYFYEWIA